MVNNPILTNFPTVSGVAFFNQLLPALISAGFVVGAIIFFFQFVLGAISWITSGGDKGKVEEARSKITNALFGLIILFSVYAIVYVLQDFLNINLLLLDLALLSA